MEFGKCNIKAGALILIVGGLGGFVLGFTMDPFFEKGFYAVPLWRYLLKAGHTHSMPIALYNIILGSIIDRLALTDIWKKRGSVFAMLTFIMPAGLIARGLMKGSMAPAPIVALGALCFFISLGIVFKGASAKA